MSVHERTLSARRVVLMGFAEALAAIETAWSLERAGFRVVAFSREHSRPALRHVRGVELRHVPAPEADLRGTVSAVRRLTEALAPAVVLPLDDLAVWVCSQLEHAGVPIAGPTGSAADVALDKSLQLDAAQRAGLPVPPTRVVDDLGEVDPVDSPVMIKPGRALYEIGGKLVRPVGKVTAGAEEFRRAAATPWLAPVHIQPLISGVGEGLFGHAGPRGVVGWSAHRRVRMVNPQGSASSACRSQAVDPQLVEASERFLSETGWRGMFMLEFLRDTDGKPWFMELNGRAWGSMALARRRGFEYPAWTVKATLDPSFAPEPPAAPPDILCRNLGLELVHLMFVARGPQSDAPMDWPRRGRALRDVFRFTTADRWYNWNRAEPRVLVADVLGTLGEYLGKMRKQAT